MPLPPTMRPLPQSNPQICETVTIQQSSSGGAVPRGASRARKATAPTQRAPRAAGSSSAPTRAARTQRAADIAQQKLACYAVLGRNLLACLPHALALSREDRVRHSFVTSA